MEIIIGKTAGFCYGVENAVDKTIEELEKDNGVTIYCLGELVHNRQVVEKLEGLGLKVVEQIDEIQEKNAKIIIRAHGVSTEIYKRIEKREYEFIDLTCPNVLVIHKLAEKFSKEGRYIFLIGQKNHPEIVGTYGFCKNCEIIEKEEEIDEAIEHFRMLNLNKLAIITQTTFSLEKFEQFVGLIKEKLQDGIYDIEIKNTICNATRLRQQETEVLSRQVDYMIVIGGKNSSNTKKLYNIAKENCIHTVCIENEKALDLKEITELLQNNKNIKIGIMAGASTPKESIDNVKLSIKRIGEKQM